MRNTIVILIASAFWASAQVYEGEKDLHHTDARVQGMANFGPHWSGDAHLLWDGALGDRLKVGFDVRNAGEYQLILQLTTAPDYGIFTMTLDGAPMGKEVDLYTRTVLTAPPLDLGKMPLKAGRHQLVFTLAGANANARKFRKGYLIGIDYLELTRTGAPAPVEAPIAPIDLVAAQKLLSTYCTRCHGEAVKVKGKVNLVELQSKQAFFDDPDLTQNIVHALVDREMPPDDEEQPSAEERTQLERLFDGYLHEHLAANTKVESVTMRRLNRYEYNHAVVDLLDMKRDIYPLPEKPIRAYRPYFDPGSRTFPTTMDIGNRALGKNQIEKPILLGVVPFAVDLQAEHGFNNRGDLLSVSPLLLEHFLQLSQRIVNSPQFKANCGSYRSIFEPVPGEDPLTIASTRIPRLLERAFRSPADEETLARYIGLFRAQLKETDSFERSMKKVISAMLASPRFLYLVEDKRQETASRPVSDYEFAVRLSFFIWSRPPDAELFDLARQGVLHEADVLRNQVRRMLRDTHAQALSENFARQWLQLDRLISAQPNIERYVTFYSRMGCEYWGLGSQMMMEPLLAFERILVEDRSLLELVDAPYTYRSDSLHTWYNDPNPFAGKNENRRFNPHKETFKLRPLNDRRQGGVIFNAATMTMTSSPLRTLPITRGAWVATVLFNDPPDPPPDDVPEIEADDHVIEAQGMTLRQRLEEHRDRPECKSCHDKIDPLGFSLEHFNAVGRWRDTYQSGLPVDASGELFGSLPFKDIVAFKDAVLSQPERFIRAFSEHMLSYSLGRELSVNDTPAVDRIVQEVTDQEYRFSALVHAITRSIPFQHKTNQVE